jgi:hypothetical protein
MPPELINATLLREIGLVSGTHGGGSVFTTHRYGE